MSILLAGFECELIQRYCHSLLCEFKLCGKYSLPPCFHSKKKKKKKSHYFRCPQTCQVPTHCFMIPALYGKKTNLKRQHSFYITTDILEKGHYWVSYLFLFIHEWIMLELTWAIVHYLLFLWIWCLAEVLKVWCLLNVIHFPVLCSMLAKRLPSLFFCYWYFGVILLKIRVIVKLFQGFS